VFNAFKERQDQAAAGQEDRIPPGQYVTEKFPVLHYGTIPHYSDVEQAWDLSVWGEIEEQVRLRFAEIRAMPTIEVITDIHCVSRWSKLDTRWEGVQFREFLKHIPDVKPTARFVVAHCEQGYSTNIPLEILLEDDALLALKYDGADLTPDHGYPLRLLTPRKYFWKSAKWLRGLEFCNYDKLGFWERYGYNNNADPWSEERYAD
jgi:DMSO/TMAO reductase YedYZ molybdopterin-dependent catalytic subunit